MSLNTNVIASIHKGLSAYKRTQNENKMYSSSGFSQNKRGQSRKGQNQQNERATPTSREISQNRKLRDQRTTTPKPKSKQIHVELPKSAKKQKSIDFLIMETKAAEEISQSFSLLKHSKPSGVAHSEKPLSVKSILLMLSDEHDQASLWSLNALICLMPNSSLTDVPFQSMKYLKMKEIRSYFEGRGVELAKELSNLKLSVENGNISLAAIYKAVHFAYLFNQSKGSNFYSQDIIQKVHEVIGAFFERGIDAEQVIKEFSETSNEDVKHTEVAFTQQAQIQMIEELRPQLETLHLPAEQSNFAAKVNDKEVLIDTANESLCSSKVSKSFQEVEGQMNKKQEIPLLNISRQEKNAENVVKTSESICQNKNEAEENAGNTETSYNESVEAKAEDAKASNGFQLHIDSERSPISQSLILSPRQETFGADGASFGGFHNFKKAKIAELIRNSGSKV
eukprot:TRINITY_DN11476_c0_g2_i1.p1 TRINITY_DN11476_c0_g2~~TRINITY_DN11476_c0_g2_i1.p1  ORF type:complete len:452 (-),score=89.14 TRINITY_DN11476_c0_g2_i1:74-1429(-)